MHTGIGGNGQLVITGATGWVGRSAIESLQRLLPAEQFTQRVKLFASRPASIVTREVNGHPSLTLPVHALQDLPELATCKAVTAIVHTAFLTRDRLETLGSQPYIQTNRWISDQVAQALRCSKQTKCVVMSSGAAAPYDTIDNPEALLRDDPYGVLKHEEETVLSTLAPSLVMRIYALSGRYIREPQRFALGDFLLSALKGERIHIRSKAPVLRSYGHAGDITSLAWNWLLGPEEQPQSRLINAVSHSTDLETLARRISELYGLKPLRSDIAADAQANAYLASSDDFINALAEFGLTSTSLDAQIQDTGEGLQAQQDA